MTSSALPPSAASQEPAAPRCLTRRALATGFGLVALLGLLVPWNDWTLHNTALYSHYLPPALILVLLAFALVVNPLLGRFRFRRGEMAVVAVLILGLGGVVSSGLMRYLPTVAALAPGRLTDTILREPLPAEVQARLTAERRESLLDRAAALDRDGDHCLGPDEADGVATADADGDGRTTRDEWAAARLAADPVPTWRWAVPRSLFLGIPEAGPVPTGDPEYRYVVDGYLDAADRGRAVRHRSLVTWCDADGAAQRALALSGSAVAAERRAGRAVLDLDLDPVGKALAGLRPGETAAGWTVLSVDPPDIPWTVWLGLLTAWAPLLLSALVAMVAVAVLVRRQWGEHERLPFPTAAVALACIDDPAPGHRLPPLLRSRAFWVAFAIVAAVILYRGLYAYGFVSIQVNTIFDFYTSSDAPFRGHPWDKAYKPSFLYIPRIYFSIIALTFFLAADVSFSLWASFVAINLLMLWSNLHGGVVPVARLQQAGVGGYAAMCLLILWIGRSSYLRLLRAAVSRSVDPALRAARPWVWALLAGILGMALALTALGAPFWPALLVSLLALGFLLVVARIVAEAGVPFVQVPNDWLLNHTLFSLVGFGLPVGALLPLTAVGMVLLADTRESLLPYAVQGGWLAEKAGVPSRRVGLLLLAAALVGVVLAGSSMLVSAYRGEGLKDRSYPQHLVSDLSLGMVATGVRQHGRAVLDPTAAAAQADDSAGTFTAYGVGAATVAGLGAARLVLPWWPLHPLGFLCALAYPGWMMWFSFLLAWLAKVLVMRYGGSHLYARLKPAAIGMIAGEAVAGGCFTVARMLIPDLPSFNVLG